MDVLLAVFCCGKHTDMPGSGNLLRVEFPNGTPWPAAMAFALLFANLVGSFGVDYWTEHYAPRQPSVVSQFPIKLGPAVVAFVPSWLGRYERWSFSLHFVFLGLFFLLCCWYAIKGQAVVYTRSRLR
jgi:hypothetical protein